jgi:hypothetical protein
MASARAASGRFAECHAAARAVCGGVVRLLSLMTTTLKSRTVIARH